MTDSQKLIAEYVENSSEAAFRELVNRYVNLVYSTALRLVDGNAHLAEDVAQTVFADLARMARTLSRDVMPGGWLHRHTCFVAAKTMRGERRRQFRERQAAEMNALQEPSEASFSQIAPFLDEIIDELGELDRTAILLRFFEQCDFRAIGETIGGSEDSARMRVNRALEKLELLLKRQGVTSTTSALSLALSINAVQAAPIGLATAVSTFAFAAGTIAPASTVIAAAKTVAMTTMQKAVLTGYLAVTVGTAIYEAHEAANTRAEVQTLQQQQTPLVGQIQQLQHERNQATNQLAVLLAENERLESGQNEDELLRLRGEVAQLRTARALKVDDSTVSTAKAWMDRVNRLKTYLDQHPDDKIPEFQFLSFQRWLNAVEANGPQMKDFKNPDDYYHGPIYFLRSEAEDDFGANIQSALRKYSDANHGQFPADLSQLRPYCDPKVADLLRQLYEIKPTSLLPANLVRDLKLKTDRMVIRKHRVDQNSTSRAAFFANGFTYWQSAPGHDE